MSTELDIYTRKPIVTPSDEHIILNALGGRRTHPLIDKVTNDVFGSTIDAALASTVNVIRVLLDAKSGDGDSPPAVRRAKSSVGESYNLLPGGKPEAASARLKLEELPGGGMQLSGHARSMAELRRLARRTMEQHGVPLHALEAGSRTVESKAPRLQVDCSFHADSWRALAKMACNLLALERRELFLDEAFDDVRRFVLAGGDPWQFVAFNTTPIDIGASPSSSMGELDHLLVVRGEHATGEIRALVVLFAHLQFVVRLGVARFDESFMMAHRVDQLGRRERHNDDAEAGISVPPFVPLRQIGQAAWFDTSEVAMNKILPVAMAAVDRRTLRELVSKSMSETIGSVQGRAITQADISAFADAVAERYLRAFCSDDD